MSTTRHHGVAPPYILGGHDYWAMGDFSANLSRRAFRKASHRQVRPLAYAPGDVQEQCAALQHHAITDPAASDAGWRFLSSAFPEP